MREEDLQEIIQGENEGTFTSYKKVKNAVQGQKERARVRSVSENAHVCACARLYVSVILIDSFDVTITRGKSCHNDRNKHITHLFETHPSLLRACLCVCINALQGGEGQRSYGPSGTGDNCYHKFTFQIECSHTHKTGRMDALLWLQAKCFFMLYVHHNQVLQHHHDLQPNTPSNTFCHCFPTC